MSYEQDRLELGERVAQALMTVEILPGRGLVGMFRSGRSDLATEAKNIVRGRREAFQKYLDASAACAGGETEEQFQAFLADRHRGRRRECGYPGEVIPASPAVLEAAARLQGSVEGRQEQGENPGEQAQGHPVDAGGDPERG